MTEAQKKAKKKYLNKCKRIILEFYPTESDLIEKLEYGKQSFGGYATYIKDLIRQDTLKK